MSLKVGMLTSGGDCQALNPAMRGVAKTLYAQRDDVEIYGFLNGYKGLINGDYKLMTPRDFSGILTQGGTILGSSRTPFKTIREPDEQGRDKVKCMVKTYKKLDLDCLVMLGGNGSHKTAGLLSDEGLNVVTLPKTIDNDIEGSELSFGFMSALEIATRAIDEIHTTATSHSRIFIVELMGHKTGWLTLYAGIAGGADIVLVPEIPYSLKKIIKVIKEREKQGKHFTIIAMAEGAISKEDAALPKAEKKARLSQTLYPSISYKLCADLEAELPDEEFRVVIPGHMQRGGMPIPYDRLLATRLGVEGANLILQKKFGYMACIRNNTIDCVPIREVAGKTKMIDPKDDLVLQAEQMGISLGR